MEGKQRFGVLCSQNLGAHRIKMNNLLTLYGAEHDVADRLGDRFL
jgi:hypothetical protein